MRRFRPSASGRRLWRPSRIPFVSSLILAVVVVASITAAAPGSTQKAWTWTKHGGGTVAAVANSKAASGQAVAAKGTGMSVPGIRGGQVVYGASSSNDTSQALRKMATPLSSSAKHGLINEW